MTRDGGFRDGNVTSIDYHVRTKNSVYFIDGSYTQVMLQKMVKLQKAIVLIQVLQKQSNWQYEIGYNFDDRKYDINDMGVIFP